MPTFTCPECGAMSYADHTARYYWCECGQPLTAADAVRGMNEGVAEETAPSSAPAPPAPKHEPSLADTPAPSEQAEEPAPTEQADAATPTPR